MSGSFEESSGARSRVWLGRHREQWGENSGTLCIAPPWKEAPAHGRFRPEEAFIEKWPAIEPRLRKYARKAGVLLLAFDEQPEPVGELWLRASANHTRSAIIGRHDRCDLRLDPRALHVALRQMAFLARLNEDLEFRCRLIDLQSGSGFSDEGGRVLEAASFDGTAFFSLHGILFMALTTGRGAIFDSPDDEYAVLPERKLTEARIHTQDRVPVLSRKKRQGESTFVSADRGPVLADDGLCRDESPHGFLTLAHPYGSVTKGISAGALDRGVLIGRYARCGICVREDASGLSRVHLLIIREGSDVLAIDTASTNGTFERDQSITSTVLRPGTELELWGYKLSWQVAH